MNFKHGILSKVAFFWQCLERTRVALAIVVALLIVHTGLLAYSGYVHSPTLNEPGHLVAGLSHWKFNRFEIYRVNPPLVRMVAALPVIAVGYEEDWSGFSDAIRSRPEFNMGSNFVEANGERSYFLFMLARWACIPFSWLGATVCYLWARDLYGVRAGVLCCALWCFSPNILAHASLITADAHATALGLTACYTFWRWLKKPTWTQAAVTGCILGLAELSKTTLILFYPVWPILWVAYRWSGQRAMRRRQWLQEGGMLLLRMVLGLLILNCGYNFEGSFKPLKDFQFISELFSGQCETSEPIVASVPRLGQDPPSNRFANTWIGELLVPFPENYLNGIDVQQSDFEDFQSPSYLRGQFQKHGWWYYYLYAISVKVPLGTLGILMILLVIRCQSLKIANQCRCELVLLAPPLIIFLVVSSKTGFSHHMRYVLPCFPFLFIWLSQIANGLEVAVSRSDGSPPSEVNGGEKARFTERRFKFAFALIASTCVAWSISSSLQVFPHSLSYFNELAGGPAGGANHLINSNIDWGQDLRFLDWWREKHHHQLKGKPFYLAYHGLLDPAELGFEDTLAWPAKPSPGFYAISINLLYGAPENAQDGQVSVSHLDASMPLKFRSLSPIGRAGYSIIIFEVSAGEAN